MKNLKYFIIIFVIFITVVLFAKKELKTLAILPFDDPKNATNQTSKDSGKIAAEIMTSQLADKSSFALIERMNMGKILNEQGFGITGAVHETSSANIGKVLGAKYLMFGKVTGIDPVSGVNPRYKKCCVMAGCLTFGCLGGIAAVILPAKGFRVELNTRIVDADTSVILFTYSISEEGATIHKAIEKCCKKIAKKISKKFEKDD